MKGDFSRLTYDQEKRFSRVFMQQGRVQLDADWNEQVSIFSESIRSLTADVIGPHGGTTDTSFKIAPGETGFVIQKGRYYVQGIGCTNATDQPFDKQAHYPLAEPLTDGKYLVYLDVWERHVTAAEDDSIREVALGGADTSSRGQIVWQVKTLPLDDNVSEGVDSQLKALQRLEKGEALWPRNPQRVQEARKAFVEYAQQLLEGQLQRKGHVKLRASVGGGQPRVSRWGESTLSCRDSSGGHCSIWESYLQMVTRKWLRDVSHSIRHLFETQQQRIDCDLEVFWER